jgi:mannitol-1-phosphate/altronate dehydrogenase
MHAPSELSQVIELLCAPTVKLITLTITEGGYYFDRATGRFISDHPDIVHDITKTEDAPKTALGLLARALSERFARGVLPPTILSCDNVKENGEVLRHSLVSFCELKDSSLAEQIGAQVSFPNSMVDRITPRITDRDRSHIESTYGVSDKAPVVCESFWQWVIEDRFSQGRPDFEKVPGVIFTSDVRPYEDMKLRLLNAGHSQCGYLGHLAGFTLIDQVAQDVDFRTLLSSFWNNEVIPNLPHVPGINFTEYCASLVARFSNPNLGDQTLRICLDGSAKIPTFVLPSIRDGLKSGTPITLGALCVAAWIRFCSGIGEKGEAIPIEDPCADELRRLGTAVANTKAFDANVFISGLPLVFGELSSDSRFTEQVCQMVSMLYRDGARKTLQFALKQTHC